MPVNTNSSITYEIKRINFDLDTLSITLNIIKGYTENDVFQILNRFDYTIAAPASQELFLTMGDSNKTNYQSLKEILYNHLIDNNIISGTIV